MKSAVVRRSHDSLDDDSPAEEALEQGTLAFGSAPKETAWKRAPRPRRPNYDNSRVLCFEVTSARSIPATEQTKRYVLYTLCVRQDSEIKDPHPAEIERRYTHFRTLYLGLKRLFPDMLNSISFPKKVLLGNFGADLISYRSAGFESLLDRITMESRLREAKPVLEFLLGSPDLRIASRSSIQKQHGKIDNSAIVAQLENQFRLLNKVYMDRSRPVLAALLSLVEVQGGGQGGIHPHAEYWAELALKRFEGVSDSDLLAGYIPLLKCCTHLWWQKGRDKSALEQRLKDMSQKGIQIDGGLTLTQVIEKIDLNSMT
ncbi:sorting nexin-21 isoform X2 [Ctenocephalides felis]|uniref:sorting nexin-21 isoform X2 n=1 Tax=Ctenocephalides felis TaxID=7515 RepID=UPI000E6E16C1|nr:sorting nexin-21 isoform X2 [Ctenocephalides felis]